MVTTYICIAYANFMCALFSERASKDYCKFNFFLPSHASELGKVTGSVVHIYAMSKSHEFDI